MLQRALVVCSYSDLTVIAYRQYLCCAACSTAIECIWIIVISNIFALIFSKFADMVTYSYQEYINHPKHTKWLLFISSSSLFIYLFFKKKKSKK